MKNLLKSFLVLWTILMATNVVFAQNYACQLPEGMEMILTKNKGTENTYQFKIKQGTQQIVISKSAPGEVTSEREALEYFYQWYEAAFEDSETEPTVKLADIKKALAVGVNPNPETQTLFYVFFDANGKELAKFVIYGAAPYACQ